MNIENQFLSFCNSKEKGEKNQFNSGKERRLVGFMSKFGSGSLNLGSLRDYTKNLSTSMVRTILILLNILVMCFSSFEVVRRPKNGS